MQREFNKTCDQTLKKMTTRNLIIIALLLCAHAGYSQIRPFDNSKSILPWIYNPTADFSTDLQAYVGYDARGNSSFTPQSVVAGLRMPVLGTGRPRRGGGTGVMGVQVLNTSQSILNSLTVNVNFAHQVAVNNNIKMSLGLGAGIFNMTYDYDALVYFDSGDPLLNNGENIFNMHLNAGFSLVMDDKLFINLAAPYLLKDKEANVKEIIFRAGYTFPVNPDVKLTAAANVDTYNDNMIYGGDLRLEWREMISLLAGADRYKYHGGLLLSFKSFTCGYTYGMNYNSLLDNVESHQLSVMSSFPTFRSMKGR